MLTNIEALFSNIEYNKPVCVLSTCQQTDIQIWDSGDVITDIYYLYTQKSENFNNHYLHRNSESRTAQTTVGLALNAAMSLRWTAEYCALC